MNPIRFFVVSTLAAVGLFGGGCATTNPKLTAVESPQDASKAGWEYFPNRSDLPRNGDFANDPSFEPPYPIEQPSPTLPPGLSSGHYQLRIVFVLESDGTIRDAVVAESSGIADLDAAYISMIRQWRYSPVRVNGQGLAIATTLSLELDL